MVIKKEAGKRELVLRSFEDGDFGLDIFFRTREGSTGISYEDYIEYTGDKDFILEKFKQVVESF